jgi:uncharacterized membrane protein YeaQ/YmgE (transglycosylase-associated protein family)
MNWTFTNLIIEIIAGIVGGHVGALASREHSFGALGHTITGAIGGAFSGVFLQTLVATVVDSTGQVNQDADLLTQWLLQIFAGLAAGAIVTMAVGMVKHAREQHRAGGS